MRPVRIALLLAAACLLNAVAARAAEPTVDYIVSFHDGIDKSQRGAWVAEHAGKVLHEFVTGNAVWVRLPAGPAAGAGALAADARVAHLEASAVGIPDLVPNDPLYPGQGHLRNAAYPDADIQAEPAWTIRHDAPNVTVAVIDDGFLLGHPDLAANFIPGYDCGNNDGNPSPDDTGSYYAHGTGVTGLLAAIGNNGIGVAGVCWNVRVMPLKHHQDHSPYYCESPATLAAVDRAVAAGVDIIVCSFHYLAAGLDVSPSSQFYRSFKAASDAGIIVVASAGNDGKDLDNPANARYPASFDFPNVVTVAMTGDGGVVSPQASAHGAATVEIAAPGSAVQSTWVDAARQPTYMPISGTSAAAPIVAGAIALIKAERPDLPWPAGVLSQLYGRAETSLINQAWVIGGRTVNLYRPLVEPDLVPPDSVGDFAITGLTDTSITLQWTEPGDDGATGLLDHFALSYIAGDRPPAPVLGVPATAGPGAIHSATIAGLPWGNHVDVTVTALDEYRNRASATIGAYLPTPMVTADVLSSFLMARTGASRDSTAIYHNAGDWEGVLTASVYPGADWLHVAPGPLHVAPGAGIGVPYTCDVSGLCAGLYTGRIGVLGALSAPFTVTLLVIAAPQAALAPAMVDFGHVARDTTLWQPVTVANRGCAPLTWSATVTPAVVGSVEPAAGVLAPGDSLSVTVRIRTGVAGPARLVVNSDDPFDAVLTSTIRWDADLSSSGAGDLAGADVPVWESFPNPLNPRTTIRFSLREAGLAELRIFDMRGAVVRTIPLGRRGPGLGSAAWDGDGDNGTPLPSGVYFCRFMLSGSCIYPALKLQVIR